MDLRINITDENGKTVECFSVYQDGSDSAGAAKIASMIEANFDVEDERPLKLRRSKGTRYGVTYSVEEWNAVCIMLRKAGDGFYADDIEDKIAHLQKATEEG